MVVEYVAGLLGDGTLGDNVKTEDLVKDPEWYNIMYYTHYYYYERFGEGIAKVKSCIFKNILLNLFDY